MRVYAQIIGLLLVLMGCAAPVQKPASDAEIAALAKAIETLGPNIDATEARRAAELSYALSARLAQQYQITDPPLIHNAKVNAGLKPRGLCYHWAEDISRALRAQSFRTLDVTRAIANSESRFLIEHSTAVLVAKGATLREGLVLDPWRLGGRLYWAPVSEDTRYDWLPRNDVLNARGQLRYAQRTAGSRAAPPLPNTP